MVEAFVVDGEVRFVATGEAAEKYKNELSQNGIGFATASLDKLEWDPKRGAVFATEVTSSNMGAGYLNAESRFGRTMG